MRSTRRLLSLHSSGSSQRVPLEVLVRGSGLYGALGQNGSIQDCQSWTSVSLDQFPSFRPKQVCAAWGHSVVVSEEGGVLMWGTPVDFLGILKIAKIQRNIPPLAKIAATLSNKNFFGDADNMRYFANPVLVDWSEPVEFVSASAALTVMLSKSGQVACFGYNRNDQCAVSAMDKDLITTPVVVAGIDPCVQIDTGLQHVLALSQQGQVYGWGKCNNGQLGIGKLDYNTSKPVVAPLPEKVRKVAAGFANSVALTESGKVYVWGKGMSTEVEVKHNTFNVAGQAWSPRLLQVPKDKKVVDIQCSNFHVLMQAEDKTLFFIGMSETELHANPHPIPVSGADFVAADGSKKKIFENIDMIRKGYHRISIHTSVDFIRKPTTDDLRNPSYTPEKFRDFGVYCSNGEAFVRPLTWDLAATKPSHPLHRSHFDLFDYSCGWVHDIALVHHRK